MNHNIFGRGVRKALLPFLFFLFVLPCAFVSCTLETSDNGDLDGMWHLVRVDTLDHYDDRAHSLDLSNQSKFWRFQFKLLAINNSLWRFHHEGDSLIISEPRSGGAEEHENLMTDVSSLQSYGINATTERFKVMQLNGKRMELTNEHLRLVFKKH